MISLEMLPSRLEPTSCRMCGGLSSRTDAGQIKGLIAKQGEIALDNRHARPVLLGTSRLSA